MSGDFRVIKLGGSLLDIDGLAARFRRWRAAQEPMRDVMIAGGGRLADVVRGAFRRHALGEEAAHWLCIRLLGVTAELAHRLLPESVLLCRLEELRDGQDKGRVAIFESERFLRQEETRPGAARLPHTWDVTSDSIAARLAEALSARELVLLKSALPAAGSSLASVAEAGMVDRCFPQAAARLPQVRVVNFRAEDFPQVIIGAPQAPTRTMT